MVHREKRQNSILHYFCFLHVLKKKGVQKTQTSGNQTPGDVTKGILQHLTDAAPRSVEKVTRSWQPNETGGSYKKHNFWQQAETKNVFCFFSLDAETEG